MLRLVVVVSQGRLADIDVVAAELQEQGMLVDQVLPRMGLVTGRGRGGDAILKLEKVAGVDTVSIEGQTK